MTLPMIAPAEPISLTDTATKFKALGDPTRLRIYQFLRYQCCPVAVEEDGSVRPIEGPTVGEVCCHVTGKERITSTISEHLKELRTAGLILMERRGKNMVCAINPATLSFLTAFFGEESPGITNECC